jgi:hypothetical protein
MWPIRLSKLQKPTASPVSRREDLEWRDPLEYLVPDLLSRRILTLSALAQDEMGHGLRLVALDRHEPLPDDDQRAAHRHHGAGPGRSARRQAQSLEGLKARRWIRCFGFISGVPFGSPRVRTRKSAEAI